MPVIAASRCGLNLTDWPRAGLESRLNYIRLTRHFVRPHLLSCGSPCLKRATTFPTTNLRVAHVGASIPSRSRPRVAASVVRVLGLTRLGRGRPVGPVARVAALLVVAAGVALNVLGLNLDDVSLGSSLEHAESHALVIMPVIMIRNVLCGRWLSIAGAVLCGLLRESKLLRLAPAFA